MNKLLTALLSLLSLTTMAQHDISKLSKEFGKLNLNDFEYITEDDPDAPATILFDIGDVMFMDEEGWYEIRLLRTKRIKINTTEGLDYAQLEIPYYTDGYGRTESIKELKAFTYNLDNFEIKKTEVDKKSIFTEQINNYWQKKVLAFPNVQPGSIVEVQYELRSPFFFNLPDWEFQSSIPTAYSEYTLRLIPFYEYVLLLQGAPGFTSSSSKEDNGLPRHWRTFEFHDIVHRHVMEDVPAFKDESYITSRNDFIIKLDVQLSKYYSPTGTTTEIITTWPKLSEELWKHDDFGQFIKKSEKKAKKLFETELDIAGKSQGEAAQLIIEYMRENFTWDQYYGKYATKSTSELLKTHSGRASDINLFMLGMLQAAGIEAQPVILSTRDHGKVWTDYPFASLFNYVVVYVKIGESSFLTDATENKIAYDRIPTRCINDKGLLLGEGDPGWINLYSTKESLDQKLLSIDIDPANLTAQSSVVMNLTEYDALNMKYRFKDDTTEFKNFLLDNGYTKVSKLKMRNYDENKRPYTISYYSESQISKLDNKLLVKPFLNFPESENKLTAKTRDYPIDFVYKQTDDFKTKINIPEGYKVSYVPDRYYLNNPLMTLKYETKETDGVLDVSATAEFKKSKYAPHEYARIKKYMGDMVKVFNEYIVLEPIAEGSSE